MDRKKFSNISLFELRPEPLAISFNDSSLRFLMLKDTKKHILPERFVREALADGVVQSGEIKDQQKFIAAINSGLKKMNLSEKKTTYAVIVLPENITFLRPLLVPHMSEDEIEASLETLLENNIPLSYPDVEADWQWTKKDYDSTHSQIMIGAAPKKNIRDIIEAFSEANIQPVALDVAALAISRILSDVHEHHARIIIHFNHDKTIFVLHNGTSIDLAISDIEGVRTLQANLAKQLSISSESAETLLYKTGFSSTVQSERSALEKIFAPIVEQINKYKSFETGSQIPMEKRTYSEIILSGYSALAPGLADYLTRATQIPASIGNPWSNYNKDEAIPAMSLEESLQFSATIGGSVRSRWWTESPLWQ